MPIPLLDVDSKNTAVPRVKGRNAAAATGGVGVFGECPERRVRCEAQSGKIRRTRRLWLALLAS
jgi:hypothetical protein